ncbi:MAG: ABC transporter ATP-binding protein [Lachnospiraceae bacterium]|nr:ABC transporter ATP-binding protein [Lachnospiraceae bacterium]MBQ3905132.1 ABC transporter ATP-binding protein [Lachnospiraceae bacterium]
MAENMIQADGLVKIYKTKQTEVLALQGLDLTVEEGELTALIGNSGSGKSTFLNMIGGLDRPSAGSLLVGGKNLFTMTEKDLVVYKRDTVGFVWQNNGRNLLPYLSAIENVMLPMHLSNGKKKREKALELLERVGMSHKKHSRLNMLSGGEQQRIAIAIALANSPKLLLADEPTGSVDPMTANYIFDLFTELNKEGQTILIVTHDVALSKKVRRVVAIRDGKISSERILKESYADRLKEAAVDWRNEDTQEEYVVMDKAGRVQIPRELLDEMNLSGNKLRLEMREGKIIITSPEEEKAPVTVENSENS